MSNPLDSVRTAFDKAVGPYLKRQKIISELKESDVGKERRAQLAAESKRLDEEWVAALIELGKTMNSNQVFQGRLGEK